MWLTRRLMVGLWPLLSKLLTEHLLKLESAGASLAGANPELKKMLAEFRKEEFLQHADFDTPYQEGQQRQPLGNAALRGDLVLARAGPAREERHPRMRAQQRRQSIHRASGANDVPGTHRLRLIRRREPVCRVFHGPTDRA